MNLSYNHVINPYRSAEDLTTRIVTDVQLGGSSPAECVTYAQRAYDDMTNFSKQVVGWFAPSLMDELNLSAQCPLWQAANMRERQVLSERARVIVHLNNLHLWVTGKHPVQGEIEAFWADSILPVWFTKRESVALYTPELEGAAIVLNPYEVSGRRHVEYRPSDQNEYGTRQWSKLRL